MAENKLTLKQQNFLVALTTSNTLEEARGKVGISRSTANRYLRTEEFKAAQRRLARQTMRTVRGRLQYEAIKAINVLSEVMDNPEIAPYARVEAAKNVLNMAFKGEEIEDLLERIEALEDVTKK